MKLEAKIRLSAKKGDPFSKEQVDKMASKMSSLGYNKLSNKGTLSFSGEWISFEFKVGSSNLVCRILETNVYHDRSPAGKARAGKFLAETKNIPKALAFLEQFAGKPYQS